jgi:hypothetical protein
MDVLVHVPRLAADESFVSLNLSAVATEFNEGAVLHCLADAMSMNHAVF